MAHFIKLTQAPINDQSDAENQILFNLDTVISVEPIGEKSVVQTRWGRVTVNEDLDSILDKANSYNSGSSAPQFDSINRISEAMI